MKFLLLLLLAAPASAFSPYPYFRLIDPQHPIPVTGALIDVKEVHLSEATVLLPLITHSPKDGCLFPSLVCEDWSPLAVGGSAIAGEYSFIVGPIANVLPLASSLASKIVPDSLPGLQRVMASGSTPDQKPVTFSAGPMWEYKSRTNKGYFRIFTGLALHF